MPHLFLEYTDNLRDTVEIPSLFLSIHQALVEVGDFRMSDFKSRALLHRNFLIGDGSSDQAFVNLDIRTFPGKSDLMKRAISEAALAALATRFPKTLATCDCDISVQISELDRQSYARRRPKVSPHEVKRVSTTAVVG